MAVGGLDHSGGFFWGILGGLEDVLLLPKDHDVFFSFNFVIQSIQYELLSF